MSRSIRQPYTYWHSNRSLHQDKTFAARAFRRKENRELRKATLEDTLEEYMHPIRYEASYNNRWSWGVDGNATLFTYPSRIELTYAGLGDMYLLEWGKDWYERIQRK